MAATVLHWLSLTNLFITSSGFCSTYFDCCTGLNRSNMERNKRRKCMHTCKMLFRFLVLAMWGVGVHPAKLTSISYLWLRCTWFNFRCWRTFFLCLVWCELQELDLLKFTYKADFKWYLGSFYFSSLKVWTGWFPSLVERRERDQQVWVTATGQLLSMWGSFDFITFHYM